MTATQRQTTQRQPPIVRPRNAEAAMRWHVATLVGYGIVSLYLIVIIGLVSRTGYETWAAYVWAPALFLLSVPLLSRMLREVEPDRWVHRVVIGGLALKLIGGFARYYANVLFLGSGDSQAYSDWGADIANEFRHFVFGGPAFQAGVPKFSGTMFMRAFTAVIYTFSGTSMLLGFVIFSFISFWGLYLFYRAYRIAMPDGLHRRYAVLVFAPPSMVSWPSSIGKDAWMVTALGIGTYGLARLLTHQRYGYLCILISMVAMGVVRPHVAALLGAGIGAAFLLRRSAGQSGSATRKLFGLLVLAVLAGILLSRINAFFDYTDGGSVTSVLDETERRSSTGGSQFESARPTSIAGLPWAVVTVLFRPFIFEARNGAGLITALEGTVLLGLFAFNFSRLARLPKMMIQRPFIGFALIYTLIFAFAFSAISNFGILARQRTQLFPIATIVLCVPYDRAIRTRKDLFAERRVPVGSAAVPAGGDRRGSGSDPAVGADEGSEPAQPGFGQREWRPPARHDPTRTPHQRPRSP